MNAAGSAGRGTTVVTTPGMAWVKCLPAGAQATAYPAGSRFTLGHKGWSHRIEHVDTDASGVVHFARFVSLFETLCLDLLYDHGIELPELPGHGLDLVVTNVHLGYRTPARYRDVVTGDAWVEHVGGAAFRLAGRLVRREPTAASPEPAAPFQLSELAAGRLEFAIVDAGSGAPRPLPPHIRTTLKGLLSHDR